MTLFCYVTLFSIFQTFPSLLLTVINFDYLSLRISLWRRWIGGEVGFLSLCTHRPVRLVSKYLLSLLPTSYFMTEQTQTFIGYQKIRTQKLWLLHNLFPLIPDHCGYKGITFHWESVYTVSREVGGPDEYQGYPPETLDVYDLYTMRREGGRGQSPHKTSSHRGYPKTKHLHNKTILSKLRHRTWFFPSHKTVTVSTVFWCSLWNNSLHLYCLLGSHVHSPSSVGGGPRSPSVTSSPPPASGGGLSTELPPRRCVRPTSWWKSGSDRNVSDHSVRRRRWSSRDTRWLEGRWGNSGPEGCLSRHDSLLDT